MMNTHEYRLAVIDGDKSVLSYGVGDGEHCTMTMLHAMVPNRRSVRAITMSDKTMRSISPTWVTLQASAEADDATMIDDVMQAALKNMHQELQSAIHPWYVWTSTSESTMST